MHLDTDPLDRFEYDPANEVHRKYVEDIRKTVLTQTQQCFKLCVTLNNQTLTNSEISCLEKCVDNSFQATKYLVKEKPVEKKS